MALDRERAALLADWPPLLLPSLVTGAIGGAAGFLYLAVLHLAQSLLGPERHPALLHAAVMAGTGAFVYAVTRLWGAPGDVELLVNNIHLEGGERQLKSLRSLLPISVACIASGGAAGPEAPLVQTTGMLGTWVADRWGLGRDQTRVLTITGMAAGFAVLFGAPLGAALFALEILHRRGLEYHEALLPAVVSATAGYAVHAGATGMRLSPVWSFPPVGTLREIDLAWALGAGGLAALVAAAFTYANVALRRLFRALPPPARPVAGGLALGLLALWTPYALTFGEVQLDGLVSAAPAAGVLAAALVGKFLGTSLTMSSGWRGGFIIPLFFMAAALGRLLHLAFPHTNEVMLMAALMAATNTGVTKTPLGSTLVVTAMTGLRLAPTTLLASVTALLLTSPVSLIESQRARFSAATP